MNLKRVIGKTSSGPFLKVNEDQYQIDLKNNLFFILDAMGGSGIGDRAVLQVSEDIKKNFTKLTYDPDSTHPFPFSDKLMLEANALSNALYVAHKNLYTQNQKKKINQRAAASGLAFCVTDQLMSVISVGSCSAFLLRDLKLEKIIIEHNFRIVTDFNELKSFSQVPLNLIGMYDRLDLLVNEFKIKNNDVFIFASQGAVNQLSLNEIEVIMNGSDDFSYKIDQLFFHANEKGNYLNQTAMILEY